MLFTDAIFFPYLAVVFLGYYLLRDGHLQIRWLLAASLAFYAYNQPWLLLLLMLSAAITLFSTDRVAKAAAAAPRRGWATAGVFANLLLLGFFKYGGFLYAASGGGRDGSDIGNWIFSIPLPIGISFYTFHGISLLVDTWRSGPGITQPRREGHTASFAERGFLYLTFFPQLIAGPIAKARDFFPQIHRHLFSEIEWRGACHALLFGYFFKSVIADNLQEYTFWLQYPYFVPLASANLIFLLIGYSMQIFADFAGYSLIAIGLAKLFGYALPDNFRFPYIAETFSEFWTRWHMSLSAWLRDYLYIPLGGNRKGRIRTYTNIMLVMFLGGLWHGAAWSYAAWGVWHGLALSVERAFSGAAFYRARGVIVRAIRMLIVFSFVSFAWLLFKLPNFSEVLAFLDVLTTNIHAPVTLGGPMMIALYSAAVIAYHVAYLAHKDGNSDAVLKPWQPLLYGAMLALIAIDSGPGAAFIYFQF
jgi:alginate O-acetyltransferase complex protein AlgI